MYCLAQIDTQISARFVRGKLNKIPDLLSRISKDDNCLMQFLELKQENWTRVQVTDDMYKFFCNW